MYKSFVNQVSLERLYAHVLKLEGTRHPIKDPDALDKAGKYIVSELERYGYQVNLQKFRLKDYDMSFYNVDASSPLQARKFLITSHYDTVINTPGADDSTSSVAIMLETARVLAQTPLKDHFRFISFTLEEGNPVHEANSLKIAIDGGLLDEKYRPTSYKISQHINMMWQTIVKKRMEDSENVRGDARKELETQLSQEELAYFDARFAPLEGIPESTLDDLQGFGLLGSQYAAMYAVEHREQISGMINLETIGYTSKQPHSQTFPPGLDPSSIPRHKSDDHTVGDFAQIISDGNSEQVGKAFFEACQAPDIDLPSAWLHVPFDYETIANQMPDLLRSDHAPFWKRGIPAVMITDTANFRNPNYHRPGDTIDTLDFDFIKKVTQTTILAAMKLVSQ